MRPLHLRAAMVVAILSILALATPALAQKGFSFKFTQTGTAASASFGSCIPDTPEEGSRDLRLHLCQCGRWFHALLLL